MTQREGIGTIRSDAARRASRRPAERWLQRLSGGVLVMAAGLFFGACGDDDLVAVEGGPGERYARAAIFIASCTPSGPYALRPYVSDELRGIYHALLYPRDPSVRARAAAMVGCFELATNGCAALFDCFGESYETADRAVPCLPSCEGQVFTACETYEEEPIYYRGRVDCDRSGTVCSEGGCVPPAEADPPLCVEGTKYPRCKGDAPVYCYGGKEHLEPACGEAGLACALVTNAGYESATCQGMQGACEESNNVYGDLSTNDGFRCRGTVSDMCIGKGVFSVDCAALGEGFTCLEGRGSESCGLSDECFEYAEGFRCRGTSLLFCNAGILQAIDCTSLGFSGCDADRGVCSPGFYDL